VSVRVSPTDKIRHQIDALFEEGIDLAKTLEQVARLGAQLIIQTAVEAEVEEFLGRARYERAARVEDARPGSRNGFCPTTIKTTAGPVTVHRPKLRGTTEKFASRLFGAGVTKTNALESLVIAGYVRGLSDRDVQATLADALGAEAALSKSTVSRVCDAIRHEFATWAERSLTDVELDYLFLDGSFFKMHAGARAEPILAAWGITTNSTPVLVGLAPGGTESTDAWADFLSELVGRGLRPPLLIISDAAPGLLSPDPPGCFREGLRSGFRVGSGVGARGVRRCARRFHCGVVPGAVVGAVVRSKVLVVVRKSLRTGRRTRSPRVRSRVGAGAGRRRPPGPRRESGGAGWSRSWLWRGRGPRGWLRRG